MIRIPAESKTILNTSIPQNQPPVKNSGAAPTTNSVQSAAAHEPRGFAYLEHFINSIVGRQQPPAAAAAPAAPAAAPETIPAALRSIPQWVCDRNRKPVNPYTGKLARVNDPSTWSTYEQARHYAARHGLGLAFVFTADLNLTLFELENCIDPRGRLTEFAAECLDHLNTYAEISRSGRGLHFVVVGSVPRNVNNQRRGFEFFDHAHACNITGNRWPGAPAEPQERQEQLSDLFDNLCPPKPAVERGETVAVDLPDDGLLQKMFASKKGASLQALWDGDWSEYSTQSQADQALCNALAFWTGRDPERIDQLFRLSGLYREKWDTKHYGDGRTYGQATIEHALTVEQVYRPTADPDPETEHDPRPIFDWSPADILKFARQVVAARRFTGRRAEYNRQAALGALEILGKTGDVQAPISGRHLAVVAGMGLSAAQVSLRGLRNRETKEITLEADTLINWLIQRVQAGDGIDANVYALHPAVMDEYQKRSSDYLRDTAKKQSHSEAHSVNFLCDCFFAVSRTIAGDMDHDAMSRPSFKKKISKPAALKNLASERHTDVLDRLVPLASRMIYHCDDAWHTTSALAALCSTPEGDPVDETDIAAAMTRIAKILRTVGAVNIFQTGRDGVTLRADWPTTLANARDSLERLANLDWIGSVAQEDEYKLKSFSPVGLAIIAFLEAQPTKTACISDLAAFTDKHGATISAAVDRMTVQVSLRHVRTCVGEIIDEQTERRERIYEMIPLQPILLVGKNPADLRQTLVTLPDDWRARVSAATPHLCTDGINRRRNLRYAHERITRLEKILDTARNPVTIEQIQKILAGARRVVDWGEGRLRNLHADLDRVESEIGVIDEPEPEQPAAAPAAPVETPAQHRPMRPAPAYAPVESAPAPVKSKPTIRQPAVGLNQRTATKVIERVHFGHMSDPKFGTVERLEVAA